MSCANIWTSQLGRSKAVPSLKTFNNRRGYLSTFFKYCLSKKYVAEDVILEVPKFKVKKARGAAETLSAEEADVFWGIVSAGDVLPALQ